MASEFPIVTVIVPVYNEEKTIGDLLSRLTRLEGIKKEIIIVDDGSTDNTPSILKEFPNIKIVRHEGNRGKGAALRTGLAYGNGDIFIIQDADLEYLPENIGMIIRPIVAGEADVVFGSRFLGSCVGMSTSHRVGNWILSGMTTLLFFRRVTDVMTGHKAFSRYALRDLVWDEDGFAAEIGMATAVLANKELRFKEVPISYQYRVKGRSKIRLSDGLKCLLRLMKLGIRAPKRELKSEIEVTARVLRDRELRYVEVPISYACRRKGSSKIRLGDRLRRFLKPPKLRMNLNAND
jgi:glycosyltransferase involved in cell wall biosynthesis